MIDMIKKNQNRRKNNMKKLSNDHDFNSVN